LCGIAFLNLSLFALAGEMKNDDSTSTKQNRIEIKDFAFNPQTITVKSGEKVTWINRDEEPHTIVSVGKQFKKSTRSTPIKSSPSRWELPALTTIFVPFIRR